MGTVQEVEERNFAILMQMTTHHLVGTCRYGERGEATRDAYAYSCEVMKVHDGKKRYSIIDASSSECYHLDVTALKQLIRESPLSEEEKWERLAEVELRAHPCENYAFYLGLLAAGDQPKGYQTGEEQKVVLHPRPCIFIARLEEFGRRGMEPEEVKLLLSLGGCRELFGELAGLTLKERERVVELLRDREERLPRGKRLGQSQCKLTTARIYGIPEIPEGSDFEVALPCNGAELRTRNLRDRGELDSYFDPNAYLHLSWSRRRFVELFGRRW